MDCCICSPLAALYKPPRNSICLSCYEGAKSMTSFLKKLEDAKSNGSPPNSCKGLAEVYRYMQGTRKVEECLKEKMSFLREFVVSFREGVHTDILVEAASGPPIPAHRALLATKSEILKNMLETDEYKAAPQHTITLPDLTHEQLKCLLEFLYAGTLPHESVDEHVYVLLVAADKYDIPFMKKFCEQRLLDLLVPDTALAVLEVAEVCSSKVLKERAMSLIERHVRDIVFSSRFDVFAQKNAHLCVEITRMLVRDVQEESVDKA